MKKLLCFLLAGLMVCSLFACGEKETGGEDVIPEGLAIGFGQADITPPFGIPLGGYGQVENRLAESMFDPLYATCLAIRDGGDIYLLYNMDALRTEVDWATEIRYRLKNQLDIKPENVMVMSTHSHSTPEHRNGTVKSMHWEIYMKGALEAAEAAIADLSPAKLYVGSKQVEKMNFVRHYEMNDGTYFGSNFGSTASGFKGHATVGDHQLRVVKIDREGDKADIAICNWGAHPCFTGGTDKTEISADYVGAARRALKAANGMEMFFILGAAGNQNATSQLPDEQHGLDNNSYGQRLAEEMVAALENATQIGGSGVEILKKDVVYEVQRGSADPITLEQCREVVDVWNKTDRATGNALAKKYGFHSVYHAQAILSNASRVLPEDTIELFVTRIGDLAIVHAPYEMFSDSSLFIKEKSPFGEATLIATMSNKGWGYFPTQQAYDYGCYESFGAYYVGGVAEAVADTYVEMLSELKK